MTKSTNPMIDTSALWGSSIRRGLSMAIAVVVLLTGIGLVVLWPDSGARLGLAEQLGAPAELVDGTVVRATPEPCEGTRPEDEIDCIDALVRLTSGKDPGKEVAIQQSLTQGIEPFDEGDKLVVAVTSQKGQPDYYTFADYQRKSPMIILALLFVGAVVLLGRVKGVRALIGLAISLVVLVKFVLPSILAGNSPVLVALTGASVLLLVNLYLAHGLNLRTTTAILGTSVSLLLTVFLASVFVQVCQFTGLAEEEAGYLNISGAIDLRGLLLGGVIIGALGVLDDVTVTQASAVWELRRANPMYGARQLYGSGIRIGRDHIASTVNTLVLAYAGAALPLLILFVESRQSLISVVTSEVVAVEVVRTLVGSLGLVASVPITTALAAWVLHREPAAQGH